MYTTPQLSCKIRGNKAIKLGSVLKGASPSKASIIIHYKFSMQENKKIAEKSEQLESALLVCAGYTSFLTSLVISCFVQKSWKIWIC